MNTFGETTETAGDNLTSLATTPVSSTPDSASQFGAALENAAYIGERELGLSAST